MTESKFLQDINKITTSGKANFYLLKYAHKNQKDNICIELPFTIDMFHNEMQLMKIHNYKDKTMIKYDPLHENNDDEYQCLDYSAVSKKIEYLESLIETSIPLSKNLTKEKSEINLLLFVIEYNGIDFVLGSLQTPTKKLFKGKNIYSLVEGMYKVGNKQLFGEKSKLIEIDISDLLTIRFDIDFVLEKESGEIYIFNRRNFDKIFNYTEDLKKIVKENTQTIREWKFISNSDFIINKINSRFIYEPLSKIITDKKYLNSMNNTSNEELKIRLLSKSNNSFLESDFNGEQLNVNASNIKRIIKMITKGFKYNFFQDTGEE